MHMYYMHMALNRDVNSAVASCSSARDYRVGKKSEATNSWP